MSDLAKQIAEMRAMLEALQPHKAADSLRSRFADAMYSGHREQIVEALLAGKGYNFTAVLPGDSAAHPSRVLITPCKDAPPLVLWIRYVRDWRAVKYGTTETVTDTTSTVEAPPAPSQTHTAPVSSPEATGDQAQEMPPIAPAETASPVASGLETLVEPEPPTATDTPPTVPTVEELRAKAQRLADTQRLIFGRIDPNRML